MDRTIQIDEISANNISEAIILAVARVSDTDPLDLSPLAHSVNPTALDMFFDHDSYTGEVTVQYEGYDVTVTSDGKIVITQ